MKKTAAIIGAGGLVGSHLLELLLQNDEYDVVIALVRRPLSIEHPKLQQQIVDFSQPDSWELKADDVFSCLGTTIAKAKTKENFKAIDFGIPLSVAQKAKASGSGGFYLVSSMGADVHSSIYYARVKGELDEEIQKLNFAKTGIFKPSMLLGPRTEFRFGELIGQKLMKWLAFLIPVKYKAVDAKLVAKAMLYHALKGKEGCSIIENPEILKQV